MALSLNGSTGISGINGSAGTPALQGGDADTGIFFGTDTASIATAGSERLIVDASGNINIDSGGVYYDAANNRLAIGTTDDPGGYGARLAVENTSDCTLTVNTSGSANVSRIILRNSNFNGEARIINASGGALTFYDGPTTERARIDSSGRLLVGTSSWTGSPSKFVSLGNTSSSTGAAVLTAARGESAGTIVGDDLLGRIEFTDQDANEFAHIEVFADAATGSGDYPGRLVFSTNAGSPDTSPTERMRIDSAGRLIVGDPTVVPSSQTPAGSLVLGFNTASEGARLRIINDTQINDDLSDAIVINSKASSGSNYRTAVFGNYQSSNSTINGRPVGYFRIDEYDGTNHNFWVASDGNFRTSTSSSDIGLLQGTIVGTQSSDIRLKSEVESCPYGLAEVNQINPIKFEYNKNPGVKEVGFSAQELQGIVPESVYDTHGDVDGSDKTGLAMKYTSLVPVLVNAVKELAAKNAELEAKVTALEGV